MAKPKRVMKMKPVSSMKSSAPAKRPRAPMGTLPVNLGPTAGPRLLPADAWNVAAAIARKALAPVRRALPKVKLDTLESLLELEPESTTTVAHDPPTQEAAEQVPGVPAGFHTLTPSLAYKNTTAAIAWYTKAFDAAELSRMMAPDGTSVWHAELKIGDSILFLNDESPRGATVAPSGPRTSTASLQLYVPDADAWAQRAIEAGAKVLMPVSDTFWGDRMGVLEDPFGHTWMIATRVRDMSPDETRAAGEAFAKQAEQQEASQQDG